MNSELEFLTIQICRQSATESQLNDMMTELKSPRNLFLKQAAKLKMDILNKNSQSCPKLAECICQ